MHVPGTVKRLIIGNDLFCKIGEFKKLAKISRCPIKLSQFLDIPMLEIDKLILTKLSYLKNRQI